MRERERDRERETERERERKREREREKAPMKRLLVSCYVIKIFQVQTNLLIVFS